MKSTNVNTVVNTIMLLFIGIPIFCRGTRDMDRIIGGRIVRIEDYPYIVSIRKNNKTTCGGSIISSNTVLTAAHCLTQSFWANPDMFSVIAGETLSNGMGHGQVFSIAAGVAHSEFTNGNVFEDDIALLKIQGSFSFNEKVQRIKLWTGAVPVGEMATISGWGITDYINQKSISDAQPLKAAQIPVMTNEDCQVAYMRVSLPISENVLCAGFVDGGVDTCSGDSGGPMVYENRQIGIVSFGIDCATSQYPGVYTNVAKYVDWIENNLELLK